MMDDISKELEKEIERSVPKPFKRDRKTQVLIVDDFGTITSGDYLKKQVRLLSISGMVCFLAACLLAYLTIDLYKNKDQDRDRYETAEKKTAALIRDKEILMAKLVIMDKTREEVQNAAGSDPQSRQEQIRGKKNLIPKSKETAFSLQDQPDLNKNENSSMVMEKTNAVQPDLSSRHASSSPDEESQTAAVIKNAIAIEKFTMAKDRSNGDLLVRFNIRNVSTDPGDVSGRIFTLLKPDEQFQDQWLVLPSAELKNGKPIDYKRGQYFSIAHFKPVKFRVRHQTNPEIFKTASVYIFDSQGDLIAEDLIDITTAE